MQHQRESGGKRIARVIIDLDVPHLDRPFDYLIPADLDDRIQLGSLVRVKWGQQRHTGWVVEVVANSEHSGTLSPLLRVLSAAPLFTEEMLATYRYLAVRFASTLSQVLSLAIPVRRAKVESEVSSSSPSSPAALFVGDTGAALTTFYPAEAARPASAGPARSLPRLVVQVPPHVQLSQLRSVLARYSARGVPVIVVVPTLSQAKSLHRRLTEDQPGASIALLDYELPATRRYEIHLRALRGEYAAVIGTRTAVWTPFPVPALMVVWDDGSDHHRERRNPQVDALDVALARARFEGYGLITASFGRSIKAQALVESGWASEVEPALGPLRQQIPRLRVAGESSFEREGVAITSTLPNSAFDLIRKGLDSGPVLVQVPSVGREIALEPASSDRPATVVEIGADRVGRELGRAFPGVRVIVSASSTKIHRSIDAKPQIVVATPGAEPDSPGGYSAVIVSEAAFQAFAPRLNAREEALARWFNAFSLSRPRAVGLLVGDIPEQMERSLVLWRPALYAHLLLEERREVGFFPARWMVALEGDPDAVSEVTAVLETSEGRQWKILGSVEVGAPDDATGQRSENEPDPGLFELPTRQRVRTLISCESARAMQLMEELQGITVARSLERKPRLRVIVNPPELFAL